MACYDLEVVRQLAKAESIEYQGRRVSVDVAELGYELSDVAKCIAQLTADEFDKTHDYGNGPQLDAYITRYQRPDGEDGEMDELYVKFALLNECLVISLASFHLPRFG